MQPSQFVEEAARAEEENPAVPEEHATLNKALSALALGLLNELLDREDVRAAVERIAAMDITVTRLGAGRLDAERHQLPGWRRRHATTDRLVELLHGANHVVRGLHEHEGVRLARGEPKRGHGNGRRRIARHRLEQNLPGLDPALTELLVDQKAVLVIADHDGIRKAGIDQAARNRLLKQGAIRGQL